MGGGTGLTDRVFRALTFCLARCCWKPSLKLATVPFWASAIVLVSSIVLGGGTHSGFLGDVIVQFLALPLLGLAIIRIFDARDRARLRPYILFVTALVLLPLLQLIPLPLSLWTPLPGRDAIVCVRDLLGIPNQSLALTLSPSMTWLSLLATIPAIAIFVGVLVLGYRERRVLVRIVVALGVISVFLGLMQLAGGEGSILRFYAVTNATEAVGFFANRNHFAAFLYVAMLFLFGLATDAATVQGRRNGYPDPRAFIYFITGIVAFATLLSGQMMARSRAGLLLSAVGLLVGFALATRSGRARSHARTNQFLFGAFAVMLIFFLPLALYRILDRFSIDDASDGRIVIVRNTISAALAYFPLGSGLGTFVPVYQSFEKPADIGVAFVNHAHNDFLELWLEAGVPGLMLLAIYIVWLTRRTIDVWARAQGGAAGAIDRAMMRAASIVLILLLAHSLVDYPLRTGAMMAIAALASALLIAPLDDGFVQKCRRPERGLHGRTFECVLVDGDARPERSQGADEPRLRRDFWGPEGDCRRSGSAGRNDGERLDEW